MNKKALYIFFLLLFTFFALEILLRIFHPFPVRLKGDKIVLPQNQIYSVSNENIPKLDKKITHTKNSLGFRGDEKPVGFNNYLSFLTIGGSTTECFYISDHHDWTFLLGESLKQKFKNVWINNAGLEGHSTFGHQVLVDDYVVKIKPKMVLFLTGINDMGIENLRREDKINLIGQVPPSFLSKLATYSEIINLIRNISKVEDATKMNLGNKNVELLKLDTLSVSDEAVQTKIKEQIVQAHNYKMRVLKLIETCRKNNIEPVFITQPCLYGSGIDSLTSVNLETIKIDDKNNGKAGWLILQLYNEQLKSAGNETNTFVIDLADEMPKNSLYFYDFVHFTNKGCEKVAEIISRDLAPFLQTHFSQYIY